MEIDYDKFDGRCNTILQPLMKKIESILPDEIEQGLKDIHIKFTCFDPEKEYGAKVTNVKMLVEEMRVTHLITLPTLFFSYYDKGHTNACVQILLHELSHIYYNHSLHISLHEKNVGERQADKLTKELFERYKEVK
jgi:hypothetical protein